MAYRINGVVRINDSGDVNAGIVTATLLDGPVSAAAITGQTEGSESDVTGADEILIYDQATGDLLRVTVDEFVAGSGIGTLVTEFENLSVTGVSTLNGAVSLGSSLTVPDGESIFLGDSGDLQITHSGSNSLFIDNGTGNLIYRSGTQILQNRLGTKTSATFNTASSVDLSFDDETKFRTASDGIRVAGVVTAISGVVTYYGDGSNLTGVSTEAGATGPQGPDGATGATGIGSTGATGPGGVNSGTEVGTIIPFAAQTVPDGWLECDGSIISRIDFSDLFDVIGEVYGAGDGSTTFQIPDLRAEFVRGWDNSRGVDPSRAFGSNQSDDFASHTHIVSTTAGAQGGTFGTLAGNTGSVQSGPTGGTETRPRNVALLYCIKYVANDIGSIGATGATGPQGTAFGTYEVTDTSVGVGTDYFSGSIIPSTAKKISILFDRIDTDGNRDFLIQLVTTTGTVNTNYDSYSSTGGNNTTSTEGFVIYKNGNPNPNIGRMDITRMGASINKWIETSHTFRNSTAQDRVGAGILDSYTGTVNGIRITSATGGSTINLSGGTISIIVET